MARFGPFCLGLLCAILLSAVCHGALEKPPILFGCLPHWSHNEKMLQIAEGLVKKGYPVTFISGALYKENVERIGATYWKLPNAPTTHGFVLPDEDMMELAKLPPDSEELQMHAMGKLILEPMPRNFHTYQEALKQVFDPVSI